MNIISKENLKNNSVSLIRTLIQASSEMNGCPITNVLEKEIKSIWLSDESLPQEIILNIEKEYFKYYPKKLSAIGIYCWHAYSTNPKVIEILINVNKKIEFISLGDFDLEQKSGLQLLHLDEDLLFYNDDNKLNDNICIKLIIKETFGGKRTYINNISLYEEMDLNALNLKSIQEEIDEDENSSMIFLKESRIKNNNKKQKKKNNANNANNLLSSEMFISDSELSDRKLIGDKVDKFMGINIKSKIVEISESKEDNSTLKKNNTIKLNKINNNTISNNTKFFQRNKSPIKSNTNTYINSDRNFLGSDKKLFLNSNFCTINNNANNINTQTSQNNLNNQTTDMLKSQIDLQNEFFSPENQNKFFCSKGEISNIEYIGDNQLLLNEFRAYQKTQDEKMKKFDERITNIENKINDITSNIENITNDLNNIINREKRKEKENEENKINKDLILKECEQMIRVGLIEMLSKKINNEINSNKQINNLEEENHKSNNCNYNKIPTSNYNKYEKNFYQTYYNRNFGKNKNNIEHSSNKNTSIENSDNYMTYKVPFYQNRNQNSSKDIFFSHKRNSTFSNNYLNLNSNNIDSNYNDINNNQNMKEENNYNTTGNNFSEFNESNIRDNKLNTNGNQYNDFKSETNFQNFNCNSHTPINNNSIYNIPHTNKLSNNNIKGFLFNENSNFKENTVRLTKNKNNISYMTYKGNNTICNTHSNYAAKVHSTKRQNSYGNINSKQDIANKINNHLEQKFADFSDKLGKNINDCFLKPSIEKLKKNMNTKIKQVKNSIKKVEISQIRDNDS